MMESRLNANGTRKAAPMPPPVPSGGLSIPQVGGLTMDQQMLQLGMQQMQAQIQMQMAQAMAAMPTSVGIGNIASQMVAMHSQLSSIPLRQGETRIDSFYFEASGDRG